MSAKQEKRARRAVRKAAAETEAFGHSTLRGIPVKKPVGRLGRALRKYRRVVERLTPSQWVEKHIVLPPGKQEARPGRVDFSFSPYLRGPLDDLENPAVRDIVFIAPTRSGKTLLIRLGIACDIAKNPMPMLLFDSTIEKGRSLVRKEIKPLIEYNPLLRAQKPSDRNLYADAHMLFPGASLDIYGANSAAGAAGDTAKHVYGNEVDKWVGETEEEASMIELVRHRTESAEGERKHYFSTTPTTEDSAGWTEYLLGDQRKFFVPCPHCGTMQTLEWNCVHWDPAAQRSEHEWDYRLVKQSAHYVCPHCHEAWNDEQRLAAVRDPRAEWRPTTEAVLPEQHSYHITGLYGGLQANRMGELAVAFLAARRTGWFSSRRDFWNSRMGEPYRDSAASITVDRFKKLMADYVRGGVPAGWKPDLVIVGVDVQTWGLPFVVMAADWRGVTRTVDHGVAASWEDIDRVQMNAHPLAGASFVIVDIGFEQRTPEALEAIYVRQRRGWVAAEGFEQTQLLTQVVARDPFLGTKNQGVACIQVVRISTYDFKLEWEKRFSGEIDLWRTYSLPKDATDLDRREQAEYFEQLMDERRVPRKHKRIGRSAWEWKSRNGRNHFFDCHVYILALLYHLCRSRGMLKQRAGSGGARREISA